jgi:hypothetical protein
MGYGKVNGRVVKRATKTGFSYTFSIVKNQRNWHTGRSEHIQVALIATIKDTDFDRQARSFWNNVDTTLQILIDTGEIDNRRSEICGKFEKYIPRPTITINEQAAKSLSKPASKPDVAARLRERFKGLS